MAVNSLSGNLYFDQFMVLASSKFTSIPLYTLLGVLLWKQFSLRSLAWIILSVVTLVVLTDQGSVHLFKEVFERPRPCHNELIKESIVLVSGKCGGKFGFISSHASNVFGLAALLLTILKEKVNLMWILLTWAALVSFSRIYLGVHYPLDVIVGALYGATIGFSLAVIIRKQLIET